MKTIIIGDIHGCYEEFIALLEKCVFCPEEDTLILNGDLMDRGPCSWEVFQKAKQLSQEMGARFILIRGSHEKLLLDSAENWKDQLLWNLVGKGAAVRSFRQHGENLLSNRTWIKENSRLWHQEPLFQCAHAGVKTEKIEDNDEHTLLMDHAITRKNRYSGKLTITGHIHLKQPMYFDGSGSKGTALEYHKPMSLPEKGVICIDTGCSEGNRLTAMVIRSSEFYLEYQIRQHRRLTSPKKPF